MLRPKKKITKKEIRHDPLLETLYSIQRFYDTYKNRVWMLGGIVIIILLIVYIGMGMKKSTEIEASNLLTQALSIYNQGNIDESIYQLKILIEDYGKTKSGKNALYYLGRAYLSEDSTQLAKSSFEEFLSKGTLEVHKVTALTVLGDLEEKDNNFELAAKLYLEASSKSDISYLSLINKLKAVNAYISSRNYQSAKDLLSELELVKDAPPEIRDGVKKLKGKLIVQIAQS